MDKCEEKNPNTPTGNRNAVVQFEQVTRTVKLLVKSKITRISEQE